MNKYTKKLIIGTAVTSTLLFGTVGTTYASVQSKPVTMVEKSTMEKQQLKLKQVLKFAKQGKVINSAFGIGTNPDLILKKWGKPQDKDTNYLNYVKRNTFFLTKDSLNQPVSFIQSTDKAITSIRYNTVKATLGNALVDKEYKGAHLLTFKVGEYHVTFEFSSLYQESDTQVSNPKVSSYSVDKTPITTAEKQTAKLNMIMKYAKQGAYIINDQTIESIRLNTVKINLGTPFKEIEYKGSHLVAYKSGNYHVTFEFPSLYSELDDQPSNPKIISYSVYK